MNDGTWRLDRYLSRTLLTGLIALPFAAQAQTAAEFATYYQNAYVHGRDLIPGPQTPIDFSPIATRLALQAVSPHAALSGNAFPAADGAVIKLPGAQGCLSTGPMVFAGIPTCAMISLAGMAPVLDEAKAGAGGTLPCHVFAQNPAMPIVRFVECLFVADDAVRSLSEALFDKGMAFAARSGAGQPVFPEYLRAEAAAAKEKAGVWANAKLVHPYGDRYRTNPKTN